MDRKQKISVKKVKDSPNEEKPLLDEKQSISKRVADLSGKILPLSFRGQAKKDMIVLGTIALFAVPSIFVLAGAFVATDMLLQGRIMPGASMGGMGLGLTYPQNAVTMLQPAIENYLNTPLTISADNEQVQVTPQELGMQFSLPQSVISLPVYDFRQDNLLTLAFAGLSSHQGTVLVNFDPNKAQNIIEQKLGLQSLRARNAQITFDQQKNPTIIAESYGKMLNSSQLIAGLNQSATSLQPANIALDLVDEKPAITASQLLPQKNFFSQVLKTPIKLTYQGQQWKFDPSKHLDAVGFVQNTTVTLKNLNVTLPIVLNNVSNQPQSDDIVIAQQPNIVIDPDKISDYLQNQIVANIDQPTSDVKIYTDANKHIVIDGKGQDGVSVPPDALLASIDLAMNNGISQLEVPAQEVKAKVTVSPDLQNLGIKNLIATGHTIFAGSHPGRIQNINVGMSRYNGLLVQPGETFSFDDHLGPVDGQHGYVEELVIKGNQGTVPDFGGGLCQVSSTIYQAALLAGFPIVERANHSYAVSYYAKPLGYGLDATIYPGVHDVKFINNSPAAIVIQAYTQDGQAYFKFYGTDDGRKVWLEGPYQGNYRAAAPKQYLATNTLPPGATKQVEIPHTGFDVTWYRHILENGKETKEKLFTRYDNTAAEILYGAGGPPPPGASGAQVATVPKS